MTSQWQTITRDFCRGLRLLGILCEFRTQQGPFDARFRLTNRCGLDRPQQIGHQIHTAHVSFRLIYLPLVMVYFAYGALGIIDVTRDMWIKESLTLSPAELAEISVWFGLPWTVKMVFGELVDTIAPDWILPGRDMPTCAPMSAFNP